MSKGTEDLTRQGRKLLAQLTEFMPLGEIPREMLQQFIDGRASAARWLAEQIRRYPHVREGQARIIDCGVTPFIPDGWSIHPDDQLPSRFTGVCSWNPETQAASLAQNVPERSMLDYPRDFDRRFRNELVLPANVLDYLIEHPHEIPAWENHFVHFPGTVYRTEKGQRAVRHLLFTGRGGWSWNFFCVTEKGANTFLPAAVLKRSP